MPLPLPPTQYTPSPVVARHVSGSQHEQRPCAGSAEALLSEWKCSSLLRLAAVASTSGPMRTSVRGCDAPALLRHFSEAVRASQTRTAPSAASEQLDAKSSAIRGFLLGLG